MTSVLASDGPFGPTALTCLLLPLVLAAPFGLLLVAAGSLLRDDPVPIWLLTLSAIGVGGVAYLLALAGLPASGFWAAWKWSGIASLILTPVVVACEGWKRRRMRP